MVRPIAVGSDSGRMWLDEIINYVITPLTYSFSTLSRRDQTVSTAFIYRHRPKFQSI
jgi:hypothetical protein